MKHLNISINGMVQGVGFRYQARSNARYMNIRGFVRNEPDGSVYIEAEGNEEDLRRFVQWCREGPGSARVDDVSVTQGAIKNFRGFDVRF